MYNIFKIKCKPSQNATSTRRRAEDQARHPGRQRAADQASGGSSTSGAGAGRWRVPWWIRAGRGAGYRPGLVHGPGTFLSGKLTRTSPKPHQNPGGSGKVARELPKSPGKVANQSRQSCQSRKSLESRKSPESLTQHRHSRPQSLRYTSAEVLQESQSRPSESWESARLPACPDSPCCSSSGKCQRQG